MRRSREVPSSHAADVVLPVRRQPDAEDVVAVGGKMVGGAETAPRPERQVLVLPVRLRQQHRVLEPRELRRRHDPGGGGARSSARPTGTARAGRSRWRAPRRCCRTRCPTSRPRAAAPPRRCRARGDRGSRCRTRCGSGDASSRSGPGSASPTPPRRFASPNQPATARDSSSAGRGRPAGGMEPALSLPITRSHNSASALGRSASATSRASPGFPDLGIEHGWGPAHRGDPALAVTGDAISIEEAADGLGRSRRRLGGRGGQELAGRAVWGPAPRRPDGNRYGCDQDRHRPGSRYLHRRPRTSPNSKPARSRHQGPVP